MSNIPEFKELDDEYYNFRIKKSELYKLWGYQKFIEKHLRRRMPVPVRVFRKYAEMFTPTEDEKELFYENWIDEKKQVVINSFAGEKEYAFSGERKVEVKNTIERFYFDDTQDTVPLPPATTTYLHEYSFSSMIDHTSYRIMESMMENKSARMNKSHFLHLVYETMVDYLDKNLSKKERKDFSSYKTIVVAGVIAMNFGYDISQTAPIKTKADVYNAVKYLFKKTKA